jgi:hypothetical protein
MADGETSAKAGARQPVSPINKYTIHTFHKGCAMTANDLLLPV